LKVKNKDLLKKTLGIFIILIIGAYIANNIIAITYASINQQEPKVLITINNDGKTVQVGDLFGGDLWYPDKKETGIIRIKNDFKNMNITNLGIGVEIKTVKDAYNKEVVYNSFMRNMKLSVKKGTLLTFNNHIFNDKNFFELLYKSNDDKYKGFVLENSNQIRINKNDFIDLKYTLYMDKEAGNELEELKAVISFFMNASQSPSTEVEGMSR
jgi:hypothetical protein